MPQINDEQFDEYMHLKRLYMNGEYAKRYNACLAVKNLEDDIDRPIKKCIAMLAMLGCEPTWSCCGFDYPDQPIYKSHQYGHFYFMMRNKVRAMQVMLAVPFMAFEFRTRSDYVDAHYIIRQPVKEWDNPESMHYTEEIVNLIRAFEDFLYSNKNQFEEVTLKDEAGNYKKKLPNWQYPPKNDWIIRPEEFTLGR